MRASRRTSARLRLRVLLAAAVLVDRGLGVAGVRGAAHRRRPRVLRERRRPANAGGHAQPGDGLPRLRPHAARRVPRALPATAYGTSRMRCGRPGRWREASVTSAQLALQAGTAPVARMARVEIRRLRADPAARSCDRPRVMRSRVFDQFRRENARLQRALDAERTRKLDRSGLIVRSRDPAGGRLLLRPELPPDRPPGRGRPASGAIASATTSAARASSPRPCR